MGSGDTYRDAQGNAIVSILLKEHNNSLSYDWTYAAIVNAGTGALIDHFTAEEMWSEGRLERLAEAYPRMTWETRLDYLRWYCSTFDPGGGFTAWPCERQKLFSGLFRDAARAVMHADPDYIGDMATEAALRDYGAPGEEDIPLDAALTLARRAGEKALELPAGAMNDRSGVYSQTPDHTFDVTDPEKPVWRIYLSAQWTNDKMLPGFLCC